MSGFVEQVARVLQLGRIVTQNSLLHLDSKKNGFAVNRARLHLQTDYAKEGGDFLRQFRVGFWIHARTLLASKPGFAKLQRAGVLGLQCRWRRFKIRHE
jgi:hypothetical protein